MRSLRVEGDNFTLGPAFPELFVAAIRSQELRDRVSAASVSQKRLSLSSGLLGYSGAATPVVPVEVPPMEVPPSTEVVSAVVMPVVEVPPATEVVPAVEVPPSAEIVMPASEESTGMVGASKDGNFAVLEDFISNVTKNIPPPLADKPLRRRRVDPVLVDAPPQL